MPRDCEVLHHPFGHKFGVLSLALGHDYILLASHALLIALRHITLSNPDCDTPHCGSLALGILAAGLLAIDSGL